MSETTTIPEWHFGDRLRKARRSAGLSQAEMATHLGVATARLSNWEAGINQPRDLISMAMAASEATGVPAEWIAGLRTGNFAHDRRRRLHTHPGQPSSFLNRAGSGRLRSLVSP